ncbi:phosphoglycerol geranylgeranyltransferase [Flavobacterium selenitireducens]|uniref:geranylgeranylglyceryl/heptaprenylglyceryl phosphate synthase n=1 Tax=Flavobacterium selenitireducens TaxID=2722704 RepID=UPI00168C0458|nr:geranylgeranylglyceryl/heptaprenylglyceryl phosphate synthase [Flavobacterium selenitireducens]MBD3582300.1 geranylgeranylglyceryl/heptaprenylglyceryl phosphate synthase [Flavobacterium selenitireducens]
MQQLYNDILSAKSQHRKLLAILLDPDKIDWENLNLLIGKLCDSPATHIFIGGSLVFTDRIDELIVEIKDRCHLPILLFPGNPSQISHEADGILFLSLLSGRNPDFLIGHHVKAASVLRNSNLEIIPTGYLLIASGSQTAVAKVSGTEPLSDKEEIVSTAIAGQMLGTKLIYLEAGSGAKNPVATDVISSVSENLEIPLIVGGGIRSKSGIQMAFDAGADLVVIGTAFENDLNFFEHD